MVSEPAKCDEPKQLHQEHLRAFLLALIKSLPVTSLDYLS